MALIPQTQAKKVILALEYVNNQNGKAIQNFAQSDEADNLVSDFTQANVNARKTRLNAAGADEAKKAVQMFLWLLGDHGIVIPAAFTDAEVDAINSEIRQFDDGT